MGVLREPWDFERSEEDRASAAGTHHEIVRDAARRVGRGAFACPCCNLPMLLERAIPVAAAVECPFCGEAAPARRFVRLDERDTPGNAIQLIARMPA